MGDTLRNLISKISGLFFVKPESLDTPLSESLAGMHDRTGHCPLARLVEVDDRLVRLNEMPNDCPGRAVCQKEN